MGARTPKSSPRNFVCGSKYPKMVILTRKRNFVGEIWGARTHFRPFFQIFLKSSKKLEHFSYLYQTHSLSRCEVMRNWKLMKSAWNVPSFCPWMVKKQAKSRKWPKTAKNCQNCKKFKFFEKKKFLAKNNIFYKKIGPKMAKIKQKMHFCLSRDCEASRGPRGWL